MENIKKSSEFDCSSSSKQETLGKLQSNLEETQGKMALMKKNNENTLVNYNTVYKKWKTLEENNEKDVLKIKLSDFSPIRLATNHFLRKKYKAHCMKEFPPELYGKILKSVIERPTILFIKFQQYISNRNDVFCINGIYKFNIIVKDFEEYWFEDQKITLAKLFDDGLINSLEIHQEDRQTIKQNLPKKLYSLICHMLEANSVLQLEFESTIPEWINEGERFNIFSRIIISTTVSSLDPPMPLPPIKDEMDIALCKALMIRSLEQARLYHLYLIGQTTTYEVYAYFRVTIPPVIEQSDECSVYYQEKLEEEQKAAYESYQEAQRYWQFMNELDEVELHNIENMLED